jgi:hypothetical protein
MNPRQMRRDEFRYRFGLFAPQDFVERGARNRLVDCHDDRLDPAFRGFPGHKRGFPARAGFSPLGLRG